jgi:hypothetical protein
MEPEDVIGLPQSHEKALLDEELLLIDEQRKWFIGMESHPSPSEDAVNMAEMKVKYLENYIKLVAKEAAIFQRTGPSFERNCIMSKMCQETPHVMEEILQRITHSKHHCYFTFRSCQSHPHPLTTTILIIKYHEHGGKALH